MEQAIIKNEKVAIIKPLYLYDHSGITISTTPFGCRWDSGQIGFVFITKEKIRYERSCKRVTQKEKDWAEKILDAEVKTYDKYLCGEAYGYRVFDEHGEELGSCWGYDDIDDCLTEGKLYIQ